MCTNDIINDVVNDLNANISVQIFSTCENDHLNSESIDLNKSLYNSLSHNLKACEYIAQTSKLPVTEQKKVCILHVNIRSINKNFDLLNHELLQSLDYQPDVLCLSETKINKLPLINVTLPSYFSLVYEIGE